MDFPFFSGLNHDGPRGVEGTGLTCAFLTCGEEGCGAVRRWWWKVVRIFRYSRPWKRDISEIRTKEKGWKEECAHFVGLFATARSMAAVSEKEAGSGREL